MQKWVRAILTASLLLPPLTAANGQMVGSASGQRDKVPSGYDSSWYVTGYWPGEWPVGFSVARPSVTVTARSGMDKKLPRSVVCDLPYRAVFNPWNDARNAKSHVEYFTASKILDLTALKDFKLDDDGKPVVVKKGQVVEYLSYLSEGWFIARINGKIYDSYGVADQSLFDDGKLSQPPANSGANAVDQWLSLRCVNGKTAWIITSDLLIPRPADEKDQCFQPEAPCMRWIDGLWNASMANPGIQDYGAASDLTDADIRGGGTSNF